MCTCVHTCTHNANAHTHRDTDTHAQNYFFLEEQYKKFRNKEILKKKTTVALFLMTLAIFSLPVFPELPAPSHTV